MAVTTMTRVVWVDDDGSGLTGTIINNAQLQAVQDAIDQLFSGTGAYATVTFGGILNAAGHQYARSTKTGTYTIVGTDDTILANGTFTVTLPTAVGRDGQEFTIKNIGTGTVTVGTTSAQNIDGASTYVISAQYDSITVRSDNANWWII